MFKTEDRLRERQTSEKSVWLRCLPILAQSRLLEPLKAVVLGIHVNPLAFVSLSSFCEVTDSLTFT
jgi:hypothetical protein